MTTTALGRIAYIAPRYSPHTGGVQTHVAQLARRAAAHGYQVEVLTQDSDRRLPAVEVIDGAALPCLGPRSDLHRGPGPVGVPGPLPHPLRRRARAWLPRGAGAWGGSGRMPAAGVYPALPWNGPLSPAALAARALPRAGRRDLQA